MVHGSEPVFETKTAKLHSAANGCNVGRALRPVGGRIQTLHSLEKGRFPAMNKGKVWRYPETFHRMAVERFKCCENIEHLSKELGVARPAGSL